MKIVEVAAGRPYPVYIGGGLLKRAGAHTALYHPPCALCLVMDENAAAHYGAIAEASFLAAGFRVVQYILPPGESAKTFAELSRLSEFLAGNGFARGDLLAALGGGVTGDLTGFAAAVYQRGIGYIQLPTTLLAAVDSSVGGKTAVNLRAGKNLAGAFWQPKLVICDTDTFSTLPAEELASGASECVKYAMLGDALLLRKLTAEGPGVDWTEIIEPCVRLKAKYVAQDERDAGMRQILNFGHTIGHAAERLSGYTLRHGYAVAIGMIILTRAAERMGVCVPGVLGRLKIALEAFGLPTDCSYPADALAEAALGDKKRHGDEVTLILPKAVGECVLYPVKTSDLLGIVRLGLEG